MTDKNMGFRILGEGKRISNDTRITNLNNNDLIVGSTGCGKTGGYVIPNILHSQSSMIIADTKCNLHKKLSADLRMRGYEIHVVDFVNPEKSSAYNPLDYIRFNDKTQNYNEQDIMSISAVLIPMSYAKDDAFWVISARTVLNCLIGYVLEAFEPSDRNLTSVLAVFKVLTSQVENTNTNKNGQPSVTFLEEWKLQNPESFAVKKYEMFKGVLGTEKTWSCIFQFVSSGLDLFDFNEAKEMFSGESTFKINDIGKKKCAVFLNISDTDRTLDKLVNIFYTQAFQNLCREADENTDGRLDVPVRIFLDDFATNTYIPDFEKLISVIRSREISVSIILQSLTQLETLYTTPQATTIVNNCDHIVYLGSNDLKTAEYVATKMSKSPESVLCMPTNTMYLLSRGEKGECLNKIKPYSMKLIGETEMITPKVKSEDEEEREFYF